MNKKFILMLLGLVISFMYYTPNANANEIADVNTPNALTAASINATATIEYSFKNYCHSAQTCTKGKTIFPNRLWVERGAYAGYIPVDQYYISATHYVVTYWGPIRKGPYKPTRIDLVEDIIKEDSRNDEKQ